jgi:UDP-GlcNAc:undecaprenyl-phosphate GlcNAc-1-phosphate transferase
MMLFTAALAGSILGFLVYNFNPASIFMGDTGAMFLGYVLGVGAIQTNQKSSTTVAILVPVVALGLPIADTLLAMLRRAISGRPMFSADRAHIHHKLLDIGLTQRQAVVVLYCASGVLGGVSLLLTVASSLQSALILVVMTLTGFFALRRLGYGRVKQLSGGKTNLDPDRQLARLAGAPDEERVWRELKVAARAVGLTSVRLSLVHQQGSDTVSVLREHGDSREFSLSYGSFTLAVADTMVKVEYSGKQSIDRTALDDLKEATKAACTRIFGSQPEPRLPRPSESRAAE